MITIYDKNNIAYFIRPCPLINLTWNSNTDSSGPVGGKYDIVLNGTLIDDAGSPIYRWDQRTNPNNGITWPNTYNPKPAEQPYSDNAYNTSGALGSILAKQVALRELFAKSCNKIEVASVAGTDEPVITFYPKFLSMNFEEGIWVNRCDYSITLEAQFLLNKDDKIIGADSYATEKFGPGSPGWNEIGGKSSVDLSQFLDKTGFVDDVQETWSLEPEDGVGNTSDPENSENITRLYRLTRNITAKGSDLSSLAKCYTNNPASGDILKAHNQAKKYVMNRIGAVSGTLNTYDDYPTLQTYFGSGILNLDSKFYAGYNHSRTENIDVRQGTYSLQDSWILSSGNSHENYNLSISTSEGDALTSINIDGTIKGLTSIPASGSIFGGNYQSVYNTAYENAINKYRKITNSGMFGVNAWTFKRAQNAAGGISLNPKPLSITLGTNEFTGEITYNIQYDNRATNSVSGVSFEGVSIVDTYPGDVFAIIPVIGRPTGPILQYIGGRTEYQRSLTIELVMEMPSGVTGRQALLKKPSLGTITGSGIKNIINEYSPAREPGIRKYFVSPPQETWDPKEGRYNLSLTWTYELDH